MRDISNWSVTNFGENSTLEKYELLSPDDKQFVIKFPRNFDGNRTNWEDVNEVIAAELAKLIGLPTVDAEIVYFNGRRACLMKHFRVEWGAEHGETAASLLSAQFGEVYDNLKSSDLKNDELIRELFLLFEDFKLYHQTLESYIFMNLFDILIANQDRHGHNWQILYIEGEPCFGPLYDNGASLGWQLTESAIINMVNDHTKMNQFFNKSKVKIGLDNRETPRIQAKKALKFFARNFPEECEKFFYKTDTLDVAKFEKFINDFPLLSKDRKEFITKLIQFRLDKMKSIFREEAYNE
ncbi:HipA domain-containing protein [Alkalibacillus almallahensis]|uniref:HipA domain-containing protein n=1 Tax=Alkalibacillus almallahensis TaxID=1379154 RepID=UPI00142351C7|nr:HipA domain-containing protein [Alkalibacillus almallahensis]NIK12443.1 hypothetical protein [Alkalibacillus almallahensis]